MSFSDLSQMDRQILSKLGDEQLGVHPRAFKNTPEINGICAFVNDAPVGYATYAILENGTPEWKCQHDLFGISYSKTTIDNKLEQPVGLLKSLVVDSRFRNMGIGSFLTQHRLYYMEHCDWIGVVCWLSKNGIMAGRILERFGLRRFCEKKQFWKNSGIPCPECGTVCLCSAILYIKETVNHRVLI